MSAVISARGLTRRFGDFVAVADVSFDIFASEVVGYLGPNGCGKTTTIRMLLGLLQPDAGEARVLDINVTADPERIRAACGYMSQKFAIYDDLTVAENLAFYAGVYGVASRARLRETLLSVGLEDRAHARTRTLSTGWRQRLALGIAIVHRPRVLFLDEPTSGVDPVARRSFWDLIYDLAARGVTVLVTTHYMDEAEYCGRVGMMREGRLLALEAPSVLKRDAVPGAVWEVVARPVLGALDVLTRASLAERITLAGDHLRVRTASSTTADDLANLLASAGISLDGVQRVEPTLEDVFLALSR